MRPVFYTALALVTLSQTYLCAWLHAAESPITKSACSDRFNTQSPFLKDPSDPKSELKPRDLEGTEWCYAYVAADLISFKKKINVSAADIAINYNMHGDSPYEEPTQNPFAKKFYQNKIKKIFGVSRDVFAKDGIIKEAIELLSEVCREEDLPSDLFLKTPAGKKITSMTQQCFNCEQSEKTDTQPPETSAQLVQLSADIQAILGKILLSSSNLKLLDRHSKIKNELTSRCKIKIKTADLTPQFVSLQSKSETLRVIDQVLDSDNIVAVRYNIDHIRQKNPGIVLNLNENNARHFSSIIGRRWNPRQNRCEYLLRNIWGESCRFYDPIFECNQGHIWIDDQTLIRTAADLVYLK